MKPSRRVTLFRARAYRINELIASPGKAMVMEAALLLPYNDESNDPEAGSGKQISLDVLVKPADWPEDKNWRTLSIDASCMPADITYPTDLKFLSAAREVIEWIIHYLYNQHSKLCRHKHKLVVVGQMLPSLM